MKGRRSILFLIANSICAFLIAVVGMGLGYIWFYNSVYNSVMWGIVVSYYVTGSTIMYAMIWRKEVNCRCFGEVKE